MQREPAVAEGGVEQDQRGPAKAGDQVVDWFGLTESNLPAQAAQAEPAEPAELTMPTLSSLGGLRP